MKNKGFTLIELLAVILILGLVATITTPIVISVINTSRQKACERQKDMILDAARRWNADNGVIIGKSNQNISLTSLKEEGYLNSKEIKNPKTGQTMDDITIEMIYDESNNQYEYTLKPDPCN